MNRSISTEGRVRARLIDDAKRFAIRLFRANGGTFLAAVAYALLFCVFERLNDGGIEMIFAASAEGVGFLALGFVVVVARVCVLFVLPTILAYRGARWLLTELIERRRAGSRATPD
jgi:hypothetical protein